MNEHAAPKKRQSQTSQCTNSAGQSRSFQAASGGSGHRNKTGAVHSNCILTISRTTIERSQALRTTHRRRAYVAPRTAAV
jgi:hypothetical protein